jgi:hypothetical protein
MSDINIIFDVPRQRRAIDPESTMIIVGLADDGPVMRPEYIDTLLKARTIFGNGSLAKAWYVAKQAGALNIYLMRLNGSPAYAYLSYGTMVDDEYTIKHAIRLEHKYGGSQYNQKVSATISPDDDGDANTIKLTNEDGTVRTYMVYKNNTIAGLCRNINIDCELGLSDFRAFVVAEPTLPTSLLFSGTFIVDNGIDTDEQIAIRQLLSNAYENQLADFPAKIIVLDCVYYGGENNYVSDLCNFCYTRNTVGYPTIGIMSARPKEDDETVDDYVASIVNSGHSSNLMRYDIDAGAFIFAVAGELTVYDGFNILTSSFAPAIGALLTCTSSKYSLANKCLANRGRLKYKFTKEQIAALNSVGVNVAKDSIRKNIVLDSAWSLATNNFRTIMYLLVAQKIAQSVMDELDEYIGVPESVFNRNSAEGKLSNLFNTLVLDQYAKEISYLTKYEVDSYQRVIDITFVPIGDIRKITVTVTI